MKKKIIAILLAFLMVTVSAGFAAVKVTVDNPPDGVVSAEVSIPVKITGFNDFLAGEFVFDFGDTALEYITVENGAVYPNGLEDYSAVAVLQDMKDKNGWEDIKDAAIFYEVLGSKVKIYLYGPYATSELMGGLADGVLFNIKGTVGEAAKSSLITFDGRAFNGSFALRKSAPFLTDYASWPITSDPTEIDEPIDAPEVTPDDDIKAPIKVPSSGKLSAAFNLKADTTDEKVKGIVAEIEAGTSVELEDGTAYTGLIKPPKVETVTDDQKAKFNKVWQDDADLVAFSMGNSAAKLVLDNNMLTTLTIVRDSDAPAFKIYYLPENAEPELAGIDGKASIDGKNKSIAKGGTNLEEQADTPDDGKTTYTVAVLMNHMSSYVAATTLPEESDSVTTSDDGSDCFINTAGVDSNSGSSMGLLLGLMAMVLGFGCIDYYLKRKRETMF